MSAEERSRRVDDKLDKMADDIGTLHVNVSKITTTLDMIFDPDAGQFHEMRKKVAVHDTFITRAKWTVAITAPFLATAAAWVKSKL